MSTDPTRVWLVIWDDDGEPNGQAYVSREAAMRDFGPEIVAQNANLVESTVQQ